MRKIDVEPHTAVLTSIVGASRGFTPISSMLARPVISLLIYYLLLFMGVCWSFALGCNLAADPAKRHLAKNVLFEKLTSKLVSSKSGSKTRSEKFVEVYPSFRDTVKSMGYPVDLPSILLVSLVPIVYLTVFDS